MTRPHIVLNNLNAGDSASLYRLISDWNVVRHMLIPLAESEDDARRFIAGAGEIHAGIRWQTSAIRWEAGGDLIGVCGLGVMEERQDAEAWYLLDPKYWGQGIVTEAVAQLLVLAFDDFLLHRVWATCLPENPASTRVLEKAGFRREGVLRQSLRIHGEWRDCWLYAILADEWKSSMTATG